jgi:hypothetical protein
LRLAVVPYEVTALVNYLGQPKQKDPLQCGLAG